MSCFLDSPVWNLTGYKKPLISQQIHSPAFISTNYNFHDYNYSPWPSYAPSAPSPSLRSIVCWDINGTPVKAQRPIRHQPRLPYIPAQNATRRLARSRIYCVMLGVITHPKEITWHVQLVERCTHEPTSFVNIQRSVRVRLHHACDVSGVYG